MMNLSQLNLLKSQRPSGLLGLALDGGRLEGVVLRRTNGSLQVQQSFSVALSLDPLTNDPALVGREIRNHLDAAGVRERRCVVGLPLKWALTAHTKLPELAEADVESFLNIEAERGFPCDAATLFIATSRYESSANEKHATFVGIPRNHIALLEQVLHAAQLRPVSFSFGIIALQRPDAETSNGVLALAIGESHVGLQVICGGGVAALRALEGALDTETGQRRLVPEVISREVRITLGQMPAELRDAVRSIRVFGPRDLAQELADEMELRFEPLGLKVEMVTRYAAGEFGVQLPADVAVSPAFSLAAAQLAECPVPFEFLPPKVTAWQQLTERYASGRFRKVGMAAASAALLVLGLFICQQWQLVRLRSQWSKMEPTVRELETAQQRIRQFRPWFDNSLLGLTILRQLTQAFPEDGAVTAKTVEIRDLTTVTCSGTAQDNQALLKTLERLRSAPGIANVSLNQIRGKSPMQFTFNFRWNEGGKNEN